MHNSSLILTGLAATALPLVAHAQDTPPPPPAADDPKVQGSRPGARPKGYSQDEMKRAAQQFFQNGDDAAGVTAEALGGAIEHIFKDRADRPTGYIAGKEGSGAIGVGLRYGKGVLYMNGSDEKTTVYWRGPSIGWDLGGNGARVFTLCYGLDHPEQIFQRFPGVEGSAYVVGGVGVNYQRADDITLAPMRAGVGLRLGANVGYLAYSKKRHLIPL